MNKKESFNFLIKNGFFHIFSANVINKIVQFGISILIVRILSKEAFGSWSYANNILSFFLLAEGLGVSPGILQYSSSAKSMEEKLSYFKYAVRIGTIFNAFVAVIILIFSIFYELPVQGSSKILFYMFLMPLFTILFNTIQSFLRGDLKNKEFSAVTVLNTFTFFFGVLLGGLWFEVKGIVIGRYLSYVVSVILGLWFLRSYFKDFSKVKIPQKEQRKEFFVFSFVSMITNSVSSMLYLLDTFLVGIIIKSDLIVASYKTATLIPFALNFIPLSVMTFAYPYFAKHNEDKKLVKKYFSKMQKYLLIINFSISFFLIVFAPYIIKILFGNDYMDSLVPFRILSLGYFITGSFRIPAGNVIASLRKVKVNFYISVISGISNIILDIVLIKYYGSVGAALATVFIFIISSVIGNIYLYKYLKD